MEKANFTRTPFAKVCKVVLAVAMVFSALALNGQTISEPTTFFDNGGAAGNYLPNTTQTQTICPSDPVNQVITIQFIGNYDLAAGSKIEVTTNVVTGLMGTTPTVTEEPLFVSPLKKVGEPALD